MHAVMNGMCACVHAYVCAYVQRGSEHGPDLQVEKSRLCKGMGGDRAENTVRGPDLQVEKSRVWRTALPTGLTWGRGGGQV